MKNGYLTRSIARASSADAQAYNVADKISIGTPVYANGVKSTYHLGHFETVTPDTIPDGPSTFADEVTSSAADAGSPWKFARCAGILATRGTDPTDSKRNPHRPNSIVALSGPVSVRIEGSVKQLDDAAVVPTNTGDTVMIQNETEMKTLGIEGICLPSGTTKRTPRMANFLLYDRIESNRAYFLPDGDFSRGGFKTAVVQHNRTFDYDTMINRRKLQLNRVKGGARSSKFNSMLSAHPYDIVAVKDATRDISIGDLIVEVRSGTVATGFLPQFHNARLQVCSIYDKNLNANGVFDPTRNDRVIGVAIADSLATSANRKFVEIPVRVGGIVSLNRSYEFLTPMDRDVDVEDSAAVVAGNAAQVAAMRINTTAPANVGATPAILDVTREQRVRATPANAQALVITESNRSYGKASKRLVDIQRDNAFTFGTGRYRGSANITAARAALQADNTLISTGGGRLAINAAFKAYADNAVAAGAAARPAFDAAGIAAARRVPALTAAQAAGARAMLRIDAFERNIVVAAATYLTVTPDTSTTWRVGEKYNLAEAVRSNPAADDQFAYQGSGLVIQPIQVIPSNSATKRTLVFHARIGRRCT